MNIEQVTPGNDAEEFDRLMAEDDQAGEPGGTKQGDGEAAPAPAAGATATEGTGGQGATGDAGASGGSSAAPSPVATGTPAPTQQQQEAQAAEDEWLSTLPDEVQTRVKAERDKFQQERQALEDRYKALHGRLTPTQQALADAQRRLIQLQQNQSHQPATVVQAQGNGGTAATPADSFFDSPKWKQYAAEFPGDAEVLRAGFEAQQKASQQTLADLTAQVTQLKQTVEQTTQVVKTTSASEAVKKLEAAHSDWQDLNQSDEYWEWFDSWRASQPTTLRDQFYDPVMLEKLMNDPDFLIARMTEYKAQKPAPAATTTATTTTPDQTQTNSTQPTQTQQTPVQTDVRLRMGVAPEVRGGSPIPQTQSIEGLTEAEQFDHLYAQEQT